MKNKIKITLGALLVSSSIFAIYEIKSISKTTIKEVEGRTIQKSVSQDKNISEVELHKLSILGNRCRGCGKCVRIDPEHFEINQNIGKAIVISSTNLNSINLNQAINNCPVQAISLN